jgi:hypothetical protein
MPGRNGGTLNVGGTMSPGRPPDEFKAFMRSLATRAQQALAVAKILDDPTDEKYLPAAKWAAEQGYGKPTQQIEHSGTVGSYVVEVPAKLSPEQWAARGRALARRANGNGKNGHDG